jgi:tRNA (guanine-N7-)-methyltransferase
MSPLTMDRLRRLMPVHGIPDGPLSPGAAFGRTAPVVLDVGCGHGAAAVAYAAAYPGHDLVAVDVHPPGIARMLAAAERAGVRNLWAHQGDALALLETRIAPGSLAAVHLFFPDPWLKARHAKRRFVRAHTLDVLADRLAPGGHVLVATDQARYAAHVTAEAAAHGGFRVERVDRPGWRPTDGYEEKGLRAGRTVTDLRLTRR